LMVAKIQRHCELWGFIVLEVVTYVKEKDNTCIFGVVTSTMSMVTAGSSQMAVTTDMTTQCRNCRGQNLLCDVKFEVLTVVTVEVTAS
jgi:hypothetical protein